ncbi:hypothetical protein JHK82_035653 [Glycine max]|uniref:Uncharacterized protein n=2 Tax=Glycine subgen. Soja TaxID=1462606 RepID=A0A0R0GV45_SOYBN|nr:hypothetical protein JHK85_036379 [Glycine max]RZB71435.1 hypothetical protein D0Y65_036082 [Glycine soja]KAG4976312.1 hypothetical protein JHK86_035786 [Glycine max]KAG5112384.1 hypothetical protein JHK82_035653 [Glycine max]KAG5129663.1 hypothetical protein JHK84_036060 [Glycine max]
MVVRHLCIPLMHLSGEECLHLLGCLFVPKFFTAMVKNVLISCLVGGKWKGGGEQNPSSSNFSSPPILGNLEDRRREFKSV